LQKKVIRGTIQTLTSDRIIVTIVCNRCETGSEILQSSERRTCQNDLFFIGRSVKLDFENMVRAKFGLGRQKLRSIESCEVVSFCCSVGIAVRVPEVQQTAGANSTNSGDG